MTTYELAQNIKAGQTVAYHRGMHWLALEDADTENMRTNSKGELVVSVRVSRKGVEQSMPLTIPLDTVVRIAK